MPRRIIDLSVTLDDKPTSPAHHRPQITRTDHDSAWDLFGKLLPGVGPEHLPEGKAWAVEQVALSTHAGTHMDAPWHYHPTTDHALVPGGRPSPGIDEVPLDWCLQSGVKLDFRHLPAGHLVTAEEVAAELARIGHTLQPLDIVLVNTCAGTRHDEEDYWKSACGLGRAATLYLLERGVRVVGTDSYSWDPAFPFVIERFRATGDASVIWEGHKAGRDIGYYQMEKLVNLEQLPATGFTVSCFPIKIKRGSAGWCRTVAILDTP
ncbi:cyclase family protein [uncultured Xylophilus sp.]|uniref:cyclase family protein n=1 Tax=uncultured Xylophilus sp. TaxID=296832 RepID=UPI0025DA9881|nr:cyclase family protein [uncultured Xylophilus sp.]